MGDLDDILDEHEKREEEEKRKRAANLAEDQQQEKKKREDFDESVNGIILPILREYEKNLKERGYFVKIEDLVVLTDPHSGQKYYDQIAFSFDTEKETPSKKGSGPCGITFRMTDIPTLNVSIQYNSQGRSDTKECECTDFAIREDLKGFFKKVFPS